MTRLHLIKLCVGIDSVAEMTEWVGHIGGEYEHVTRMAPKRVSELLAGGSLYWVIKGQIACRQRLLAIVPVHCEDGISRCKLILEGNVVPVVPRPFRAFQGWRYLADKDAPPDLFLSASADHEAMPEAMQRDLAALGLL